jgi:hypothetical protein
MGLNLSLLQIHTAARTPSDLQALLASHLREKILAGPFTVVSGDYQLGEWTIRLWTSGPSWLFIEGDLAPAFETYPEAAQIFSAMLKTPVIMAVLHDSDMFHLELFKEGRSVDIYSNIAEADASAAWEDDDDVPSAAPMQGPRLHGGNAGLWNDFLPEGVNTAMLQELWNTMNPLAAEDAVFNTGELLGMDPARWFSDDVPDALELRFLPLSISEKVQQAEGAPRLMGGSYSDRMTLSVGNDLQWLGRSVINIGGATEGLEVLLSGSAIDAELIAIERCSAFITVPRYEEHVHLEPVDSSSGTTWVARFPAMPIGAGLKEPLLSLGPGIADWEFQQRQWVEYGAMVIIHFQGRCVKQGQGDFVTTYQPLANPNEGQAQHRTLLEVR